MKKKVSIHKKNVLVVISCWFIVFLTLELYQTYPTIRDMLHSLSNTYGKVKQLIWAQVC